MEKLQLRRAKVVSLYHQAQKDGQFHKTAQARHILTMIADREHDNQKLKTKLVSLWRK